MAKASVISPYQRFWNDNIPLAGGSIELYLSGSDDLARVFLDAEMKIPQSNPYRLDASGRIRGDLRFAATCTLLVKDPQGTLVGTIENVTCFDSGSAFALWNAFTAYGAGGTNIVTGSDGNYYKSLVDDNLGNDPISSPNEWQPIFFFAADENTKLQAIGAITPSDQSLLLGNGTAWEASGFEPFIPNYLSGLGTALNSGDSNVIDISTGTCADSTNAVLMTTSAISKDLQETWAAGTGNGGLADGASYATNTWYHLFIVLVDDEVDAMFDTSAVCANGVANNGVTHFRRIASVKTLGIASITQYFQRGNYFYWNSPMGDEDEQISTLGASTLIPLSTPSGIETLAQFIITVGTASDDANLYILALNPAQTATVPSASLWHLKTTPYGVNPGYFCSYFNVKTDTSSQVRVQATGTAGNTESFSLYTIGWIDTRGQ